MTEGESVLVVEDNDQNLELILFLLEEAGIPVHAARDAGEFQACVRAKLPDLILMDMQLPGTDGLSLVRELRANPLTAHLTIVAFTAHAMRGDRQRFLAGGCDGYIPKPINVATFVEEIKTWIAAGRSARPFDKG